jgi:hypothetical protein
MLPCAHFACMLPALCINLTLLPWLYFSHHHSQHMVSRCDASDAMGVFGVSSDNSPATAGFNVALIILTAHNQAQVLPWRNLLWR